MLIQTADEIKLHFNEKMQYEIYVPSKMKYYIASLVVEGQMSPLKT